MGRIKNGATLNHVILEMENKVTSADIAEYAATEMAYMLIEGYREHRIKTGTWNEHLN